MVDVLVAGLVCRDLVVAVDELPDSGSAPVTTRLETLGGAANIAVACRQLGLSAGLVGVLGQDAAADLVLDRARQDGIDVTAVVQRAEARTPLVVGVVEADGTRRLLEHVPPGALLSPADVHRAAPRIAAARAVVADLQQPDEAVVETVRLAAGAGGLVVLDGEPQDPSALAEVWRDISVLRADDDEAAAYVGSPLRGVADAQDAGRQIVADGPAVVALGAGAEGNVLVWQGGHCVYPLLGEAPVDPTGGGDAFVAGLVSALLDGADPQTAGWWASAAAALTVQHLGGRPSLNRGEVRRRATRASGH